MRYCIEVVSGARAGSKIQIESGQSVTFGRTRASEIFDDDAAISGLHFEIRSDGEKFALKNYSRTNGTWVNGARVDTVILRPGDTIRAGKTQFVLADATAQERSGVRIQSWRFKEVPQGWELLPEHGFRRVRDAGNTATIMASEDHLPEGYDLNGYLDIQLTLISQRLPHAKTSKAPADVPGAENSAGLSIRTTPSDGRIAVQKQIYATTASKVGIVTATAMEHEPVEIHQAIEEVMASAVFKPESGNAVSS